MLIRSQDRKMLLNLDNISAFTLDGPGAADDEPHSEKTVTAYMIDTSAYFIGTYSTEEKALDILDQIEDMFMESKSVCKVTYQMPEDSEEKYDFANFDSTL